MSAARRLSEAEVARLRDGVYDAARDSICFFSLSDLRILHANPYAQEVLGRSLAELQEMTILDLHPPAEHARIREMLERVERDGFVSGGEVLHSVGKDGAMIPVQYSGRLLGLDDMTIVQCIGRHAGPTVGNAGLLERAAESKAVLEECNKDLAIINRVSLDISRTIDYRDASQRIIDAAVKLVDGDFGGIVVVRRRAPYVFFHGMTEAMRREVERTLPGSISDVVMRTGKPVIVGDYPAHPNALPLMVERGIKSLVAAPLRIGERVLGAIIVDSITPSKFDEHDMAMLEGIAAQAAVAIENSRLYAELKEAYEKEHERMMILQRSLLPSELPEIDELDVATFYESSTEAALVGGDFYDAIELDENRYAFVIGDVAGKGVEAAATTSMVRNTVRAFAFQDPDPSFVLTRANEVVAKQLEAGMFITLAYALFDRRKEELELVNAGHPYPLFCPHRQAACYELEGIDPAFGIISGYRYHKRALPFQAGSILVLYTDGLIEARRGKELFGIERVKQAFETSKTLDACELASALVAKAREFSRDGLTDDIALLALKRV